MTHQANASRERAHAATGLPDPIVSAGINNFPIFDPSFRDFLPTNKSIGIQQKLPSFAGRSARAGTALARANETSEMRSQRYAALRGELISLLHDKRRASIQRRLAEERRTKYDELTQVAELEINAGRPTLFRLAEIEGERAEIDRMLVDLNGQVTQIDARLTNLLGAAPDTPPPPLAPIDWSGDAMAFHAARVADAGVAVRDRGIEEAKAAWKPEWGAQLIYQQREADRNFAGDDWVSGMVSVTVPFWAKKIKNPGCELQSLNAPPPAPTMQQQQERPQHSIQPIAPCVSQLNKVLMYCPRKFMPSKTKSRPKILFTSQVSVITRQSLMARSPSLNSVQTLLTSTLASRQLQRA
jgi:outer membrane protein TolC